MELNVVYKVPGDQQPSEAERTPESAEERDRYLAIIRQHIMGGVEQPVAGQPLAVRFETPSGRHVYLKLWQFGQSNAAIWFNLHDDGNADPVAASIQLMGFDGAQDVAAVDALRTHQSSPLPAEEYNAALAQRRPCLYVRYFDRAWFADRTVEMLVRSLARETLTTDGVTPSIEPQREPTPEQAAAMRDEINKVGEVFAIIQRDWSQRRTLKYTVRASERISGRPIADVMHVRFWVGIMGQGHELSIDGLVAVFEMLRGYVEQLPGLKNLKQPQTRHTVTLKHDPAVLAAALPQITILEPD